MQIKYRASIPNQGLELCLNEVGFSINDIAPMITVAINYTST
jgi:hypothetical protein